MPRASAKRSAWIVPILVFLTALALRFSYLEEARQFPDFTAPLVDAGYHDYWAWGMASGEWELPPGAGIDPQLASTPYFRPPLTTFWLAAIFKVFGHEHVAVRCLQILLGALSCVLVVLLARRLFDSATATLSGFMSAAYWALIYFDTEYREVSLLVFLTLAMLLALLGYRDRPSWARAGLVGLFLGLAALAKPNTLLLLPVVLGWMWIVAGGQVGARRRALDAGLVIAGAALCVLPVTLRNALKADDPVLVSSNGGINLYIGNNPTSSGVSVDLPPPIPPFNSAFDYASIVQWVEGAEGRTMKHSEVSRWFAGHALDYALESPGRVLLLSLKKALVFWSGVEVASEKDLLASRRESTVLNVVPLNFAFVFATACLGALVAVGTLRRNGAATQAVQIDRAGLVLVLLVLAITCLSFVPFFVTARYRVPLIPLLLVLSAHGLVHVVRAVRERRVGAALACVAGGGLLYAIDLLPIPGYAPDPGRYLVERGALYAVQGESAKAERAFREALELSPDNASAHNNLGLHLREHGRSKEAVPELRRAIELDPGDFRSRQNLALALLDTGEPEAARRQFKRAVDLNPLGADLARTAGQELRIHGDLEGSLVFLQRSLQIDPTLSATHLNLALTLLASGEAEKAAESLRVARVDPLDPEILNTLGVNLIREGRASDAVLIFEAALLLSPDHRRIRKNLERARENLDS